MFCDALSERRGATREWGLSGLLKAMRRDVITEELEERGVEVAEGMLACVRTGGTREATLAAEALAVLFITLQDACEETFSEVCRWSHSRQGTPRGTYPSPAPAARRRVTGRRAPQVKDGLRDVLRSHRQAVVRARAGSALAAGSFMGGEDPADASALMSALLKAALPGDAHKDAAAAHLDAWALLASGVPDGFVADRCGPARLPFPRAARGAWQRLASDRGATPQGVHVAARARGPARPPRARRPPRRAAGLRFS